MCCIFCPHREQNPLGGFDDVARRNSKIECLSWSRCCCRIESWGESGSTGPGKYEIVMEDTSKKRLARTSAKSMRQTAPKALCTRNFVKIVVRLTRNTLQNKDPLPQVPVLKCLTEFIRAREFILREGPPCEIAREKSNHRSS